MGTTSPHMLILILTELPTWLLEGGGRSLVLGGREREGLRGVFPWEEEGEGLLDFGQGEPDSEKARPWKEGHPQTFVFEFSNTISIFFLFLHFFVVTYQLVSKLVVSGSAGSLHETRWRSALMALNNNSRS